MNILTKPSDELSPLKPSLRQLHQAFEQCNQLSDCLRQSMDRLNNTARCFQTTESSAKHPADGEQLARHLRGLLDAIPGVVVVLDPGGLIVECNAAATALLGKSLSGKSWRVIVQSVFLTDLDQGELKTADGRQFSISTRPLGFQPGQILLLSDVSQTRQLQRAAQQNLHLMTMGKMMASLAHQIRTPLASTMLYLSQVVDGEIDDETSLVFNQKALARVKHIEKMVNDMLVFAHGGQFNMSRFSIQTLMKELQDQIHPQLAQRKAVLGIIGDDIEATLHGNQDALIGALGNLCMNALDAADSQPLIQIEIALNRQGLLSIMVADNGKGIDAKTSKHLFDPFFSTKEDGTGLGLAVVKSVIESHQGSIEVTSTLGEGCRFEITLPCQQGLQSQLSKPC